MGIVGKHLRDVQTALYCKFVPYHLGFEATHKLSMKRIKEEFSTWMCKQISEYFFKSWIAAVIDGTYVYCQNFGGFEGQKMLFNVHKHRRLSKVS